MTCSRERKRGSVSGTKLGCDLESYIYIHVRVYKGGKARGREYISLGMKEREKSDDVSWHWLLLGSETCLCFAFARSARALVIFI